MAKRKRIGLIFNYNENWIGGTYYFLNLVSSLLFLDKKKQPIISVVSKNRESFEFLRKESKYPYLEYYNEHTALSLFKKIVNKAFSIFRLPKIYSAQKKAAKIDMLFKYYADASIEMNPMVLWIPDFQEKFLPHYFSEEDIAQRQTYYENIAENGEHIVFSSYNAHGHFQTFFPASHIKKYVLQFAVVHPALNFLDASAVKKKYNLSETYFFTPNQFWAHKNHMVLLKAVKLLKDKGVECTVAFSGNATDDRHADYMEKINNYIKENGIQDNVRFLGFLPREDQLTLMKEAKAIVQPSFFEGWSTVVEDAKSLNAYIILSNIDVHKEQIQHNCSFFDPHNDFELSGLLEKFLKDKPKIAERDYTKNIVAFGNSFVSLIDKVTENKR